MAAVGPSTAFENLLQALREQCEQDLAYARKQASLDAGQVAALVAAINNMRASSGPQTKEPEAAIIGMSDLCPHSIWPEDSMGGMMQVVPLDPQSASSVVQAGTGAPRLHSDKPKQPDKKPEFLKASSLAPEVDELDVLPPLERFVSSTMFDKISAVLLLSNAIFIAIQVQLAFDESSQDSWVDVVDFTYCVLFILELGTRLLGFGCRKFWCDPANKWWNIFDCSVVAISTIDTILTLASKGQSSPFGSISVLRVSRLLRTVRVIRIIRVLKFFQDLRILIASILSTIKTATFAFALIFMIIFMFAIGITQLVAEHIVQKRAEGNPVDPDDDMLFFFGSVARTIFALFMTIAGGIDWKDAAVPLMTVGPLSFFFYISFVVLMLLCVMNVLTGLFCQSAIDTAQNDREMVMQLQLQEKKDYVQTLEELFSSWDDSGDGKCTKQEFESHMYDRDTEVLLRTLGIDARDALVLFELLDSNGNREIDLEEFVTGCITLRGGAKAVHMERVSSMSTIIADSLDAIDKKVQQILEQSHRHRKDTAA